MLNTTLATKKGECSSFAGLMMDCFFSHGIDTANPRQIIPNGAQKMVIRKWSIDRPGTQPAPFIYSEKELLVQAYVPPPFDITGGVSGDWSLEPVAPGQNNSTPSQKVFQNHWIVEYNTKLYDPSYGLTYANLAGFVSQSVQGVAIDYSTDASNRLTINIKSPAVSGDVQFFP